MKPHPCLSCGACCAYFRVAFHCSESLPESFGVPEELTQKLDSHRSCMKGTNKPESRCIALKGEIGKKVSCSIYENRPGCCRYFSASYEDGRPNPRCDKARALYGLKPLTRKDWNLPSENYQEISLPR